jgi:hypothetical protein
MTNYGNNILLPFLLTSEISFGEALIGLPYLQNVILFAATNQILFT